MASSLVNVLTIGNCGRICGTKKSYIDAYRIANDIMDWWKPDNCILGKLKMLEGSMAFLVGCMVEAMWKPHAHSKFFTDLVLVIKHC